MYKAKKFSLIKSESPSKNTDTFGTSVSQFYYFCTLAKSDVISVFEFLLLKIF